MAVSKNIRLFAWFVFLILALGYTLTEARKSGRSRSRRFCPAVPGKRRPPIMNVDASFDISKGKAVFRVKTCRDPPVCFLATTSATPTHAVEYSLWQTLLDAFLGKLDIKPAFQVTNLPGQPRRRSRMRRPDQIPFFQLAGDISVMYPVLESLCNDSYGVYSFVKMNNRTTRPPLPAKVQGLANLLSPTMNTTRNVRKVSRRPRAHWMSLQRLFMRCASCSRICVHENEAGVTSRFTCSTIRIKCSFRCGMLERLMKHQRNKRRS